MRGPRLQSHPLPLPATEMGDHLVKHGDGVKDIAFEVQDCDYIVQVRPRLGWCGDKAIRLGPPSVSQRDPLSQSWRTLLGWCDSMPLTVRPLTEPQLLRV